MHSSFSPCNCYRRELCSFLNEKNIQILICAKIKNRNHYSKGVYKSCSVKSQFYQSRIFQGNNSLIIQSQLLGALRQSSMFSELCRKVPRSAIGAHYEMVILVNQKFTELFSTILFLRLKTFLVRQEKKILLKHQTCDLLSIHKQTWLPAVQIYCNCRYRSTFEIHGDFFWFSF